MSGCLHVCTLGTRGKWSVLGTILTFGLGTGENHERISVRIAGIRTVSVSWDLPIRKQEYKPLD